MLLVETIPNGPFVENCYLVWDDTTQTAVFIDPGDEAQRLIRAATTRSLSVVGVFATHCHVDHVGAAKEICDTFDAPFWMHEGERGNLTSLAQQAALFGLATSGGVPARITTVSHGDTIAVGKHVGTVLETPGHTAGGVCLRFDSLVFSGDTLFAGSVGRSDLPGGDGATLIRSIRQHLLPLPDETAVYPGHGPQTTIGQERRFNPFLQ